MTVNVPNEFIVTFSEDELGSMQTTRTIFENLLEQMVDTDCDEVSATYTDWNGESKISRGEIDTILEQLTIFTEYANTTFKIKRGEF
jgi:hypothetical protein